MDREGHGAERPSGRDGPVQTEGITLKSPHSSLQDERRTFEVGIIEIIQLKFIFSDILEDSPRLKRENKSPQIKKQHFCSRPGETSTSPWSVHNTTIWPSSTAMEWRTMSISK